MKRSNALWLLLGGAVLLGASGYALIRRMRKGADAKRREHREWLIDESSEASFPASDPPSFVPTMGPGAVR